ncbi:hypothetical protein CEXT_182801 [Caerostris extrusa]|uniref:Uncharacterized protein n=1 Tax=Caerostris extrusa TaxID=172846 RepID=A0AAV4RSW5_CAEEX|nr:hypothetical protein CEXT_182801 [Caerostris extrusa]
MEISVVDSGGLQIYDESVAYVVCVYRSFISKNFHLSDITKAISVRFETYSRRGLNNPFLFFFLFVVAQWLFAWGRCNSQQLASLRVVGCFDQ